MTEPTPGPVRVVRDDDNGTSYVIVPLSEITYEELIRQRDAVVACLNAIKARYQAEQDVQKPSAA